MTQRVNQRPMKSGGRFSRRKYGRLVLGVAALLAALASLAGAQANLSTQGFGYPPGELSSRAVSTGGAVAEMDPWSPVNPASIAVFTSKVLFFQIEPEYRTVAVPGGNSDRTTTARYPVIFGAMPVGDRWVMSLGASTLLDRTSSTTFAGVQQFGADTQTVTTVYRLDGAINDVRLAAATTLATWLRVGVGAHALTGRNLVTVGQRFRDTASFANFSLQRNLSFSGEAASIGGQVNGFGFVAAASLRHGGTLHMSSEDTILADAKVPDHYGFSLAYVGIANSAIAVRAAHENWSAMNGLAAAEQRSVTCPPGASCAAPPSMHGRDAWDTSVGADLQGPKFGEYAIQLRAGYRNRTLPFDVAAHSVTEHSVSGGLGTLLAAGHMGVDVGIVRATRDASTSASEHAWTLSIGLTVRP